jgi:hypothetical protein
MKELFKRRGYLLHDNDIIRCIINSLFRSKKYKIGEGTAAGDTIKSFGWRFIEVMEECVEIESSRFKWVGPDIDRSLWNEIPKIPKGTPYSLLELIYRKYFLKAMTLNIPKEVKYESFAGQLIIELNFLQPPFMVTKNGKLFVNDLEFYELWANWIIAHGAIEAAFRSGCFICPVRHPSTSWMFPKKGILPSGETCLKGLRSFSCGIWNPGHVYEGPHCHWTNILSQLLNPFGGRIVEIDNENDYIESPWKHSPKKNIE